MQLKQRNENKVCRVNDETMIKFAEDVVLKLKEKGVDNLEKFGLEFAS